MRGHILVIDDEEEVYEDLKLGIGKAHKILYAERMSEINSILQRYPIDLAMVDLNMKPNPEEDRFTGLDYIKTLRSKYPTMIIAVLSKYSQEDRIVQATKNGADHYLIKSNLDTDSNEFRNTVRKWINSKKKLDKERELAYSDSWASYKLENKLIKRCRELFEEKKSFILIGEPGLGRNDLLIRTYQNSPHFKKDQHPPFVHLNEYSETDILHFFGLRRGTAKHNFLKKTRSKILFLEGIAKHSPNVQEQILKVLQTERFIQSSEFFPFNWFLLLNVIPIDLIRDKKFSPEFFSYLENLRLRPLRERRGEMKLFIESWLKRHELENLKFSKEAIKLLRRYNYPGNVSELSKILNQSIEAHKKQHRLNWKSEDVQAACLPSLIHQTPSDLFEDMQFEVARVHLMFIEEALQRYEGERQQKDLAAKDLNVHSADNLKKTFINKYWHRYPGLMKGFPTIMKRYKLDGKD